MRCWTLKHSSECDSYEFRDLCISNSLQQLESWFYSIPRLKSIMIPEACWRKLIACLNILWKWHVRKSIYQNDSLHLMPQAKFVQWSILIFACWNNHESWLAFSEDVPNNRVQLNQLRASSISCYGQEATENSSPLTVVQLLWSIGLNSRDQTFEFRDTNSELQRIPVQKTGFCIKSFLTIHKSVPTTDLNEINLRNVAKKYVVSTNLDPKCKLEKNRVKINILYLQVFSKML